MFSRERREVKETPSFSFFQNSVYKERRDDEASRENYWNGTGRLGRVVIEINHVFF
jgi:hypothetical protein